MIEVLEAEHMRVLVTGITRFVGSHFADHALARDATVVGSYWWRSNTENIDHLRDRVELVECNLRDMSSAHHLVEALLTEHPPFSAVPPRVIGPRFLLFHPRYSADNGAVKGLLDGQEAL